jgi:hypothetical protein
MKTKIGTIDITPSWRSILPILLEVWSGAETPEARKLAFEELSRMADAADDAVNRSRAMQADRVEDD